MNTRFKRKKEVLKRKPDIPKCESQPTDFAKKIPSISYFFIAGKRHHNQGSLHQSLLGLMVSNSESMIIVAGEYGCRQADVALDQ